MIRQKCRRHPAAPAFMATCSGCAQELHDLRERNLAAAATALAAEVRAALGLRDHRIHTHLDETATRVTLWSARELNALFARVGGTVTARPTERPLSDGSTYTFTEVTVSVDLPGIGIVEAVTDWDPAAEPNAAQLPVLHALPAAAAA